MPLKLNSTGGGSVTLDTPSTASAYTLTVPALTGTAVVTGSTGTVTPTMLSTGYPSWDSSGNLSFNSGYGSVATAYGCRAWVRFNGTGTIAINGSANVSSIGDGGAGIYTVNFTTSMPDANYSAVFSFGTNLDSSRLGIVSSSGQVAASFKFQLSNQADTVNTDSSICNVAIFR